MAAWVPKWMTGPGRTGRGWRNKGPPVTRVWYSPFSPQISAPGGRDGGQGGLVQRPAQEGDVQTVEPDELDHRAEARLYPFPGQGCPPLPPQGQQAGKPGGGAALLVPLPMIGDVDVPEGAGLGPQGLGRASALSKEAL